jgi:hypothetical protein
MGTVWPGRGFRNFLFAQGRPVIFIQLSLPFLFLLQQERVNRAIRASLFLLDGCPAFQYINFLKGS